MRDQRRADPKKWNWRTRCTTRERMNFVSVGSVWTSRELVAEAVECYCYPRNVQDFVTDERRFNSPSGEPKILFGAEEHSIQYLQKTTVECISSGTQVVLGIFMGYALNAGGSCMCDLLIVDTEDLKAMGPTLNRKY